MVLTSLFLFPFELPNHVCRYGYRQGGLAYSGDLANWTVACFSDSHKYVFEYVNE